MQLNLQDPLLGLQPGEVLSLDDAAGMRIRARQGVVWVTEEGYPIDYIVGPGESLIVDRAGRTVIQAMEPSWVDLCERNCQ